MSDRLLFARFVSDMMNLFHGDESLRRFQKLAAQNSVIFMEQPPARRRYPQAPTHPVRIRIVVQSFVVEVLEKPRAQGNDGTAVFFNSCGEHFRNVSSFDQNSANLWHRSFEITLAHFLGYRHCILENNGNCHFSHSKIKRTKAIPNTHLSSESAKYLSICSAAIKACYLRPVVGIHNCEGGQIWCRGWSVYVKARKSKVRPQRFLSQKYEKETATTDCLVKKLFCKGLFPKMIMFCERTTCLSQCQNDAKTTTAQKMTCLIPFDWPESSVRLTEIVICTYVFGRNFCNLGSSIDADYEGYRRRQWRSKLLEELIATVQFEGHQKAQSNKNAKQKQRGSQPLTVVSLWYLQFDEQRHPGKLFQWAQIFALHSESLIGLSPEFFESVKIV